MIASDLDGTLLTNNGTLSEYTYKVLKEAHKRGIKIAVASGRAFHTMPECILNLEHAHFAVTSNGAAIYDLKKNKLLKNYFLKEESAKRVIEYAKGRQLGIELFVDGRAYAEKYYFDHPEKFGFGKKSTNYLFTTRTKLENFEEFFKEHSGRLESIAFILKEPKERLQIREELCKDTDLYITSSHKKIVEFSNSQCGKENALKYLLEKEKCKGENLVAFGNAENDISMIEFAKIGVATANSPKKVKQKADFICASNDEDGVAKFIEEKILRGEENVL